MKTSNSVLNAVILMKLKRLFLPLIGLALVSLAAPSYAVGYDYKTFPGAACQP
jgi:hypothetical protein